MRCIFFALLVSMISTGQAFCLQVDYVLVHKSGKKMYLLAQGERVREYDIILGWDPEDHKRQEDDGRTPEGEYILDYKKPDSSFYKAIHISCPNEQDRAWARERGVDPSGLIMIHGRKNGVDRETREAQNTNGPMDALR